MRKSAIIITLFLTLSSCDPLVNYTFFATNGTRQEIYFYRSIDSARGDTIKIMPGDTKIILHTELITRPKENYFKHLSSLLPRTKLMQKDRVTVKDLGDSSIWHEQWPTDGNGRYDLIVDSTFF